MLNPETSHARINISPSLVSRQKAKAKDGGVANAVRHPNTKHHRRLVRSTILRTELDPLDDNGPLTIQLIRVPLMALLLAVLEPGTLVILQHPMLAAEMSLAEGAVAYDALRRLLAVFVCAADFFRRTAADG